MSLDPCSNGNIMPSEHYGIFETDENSIEILILVLVETLLDQMIYLVTIICAVKS
jgi:hypothetical protein